MSAADFVKTSFIQLSQEVERKWHENDFFSRGLA